MNHEVFSVILNRDLSIVFWSFVLDLLFNFWIFRGDVEAVANANDL